MKKYAMHVSGSKKKKIQDYNEAYNETADAA